MEKTPKQDALVHIVACKDKSFLEERYIDSFKGRGVFTHKAIAPSTFVVEYRGRIFPVKDTRPEKKCSDTLKNFLFEFSWKGERWCVDASKEDKTLGRLVNDDHTSPNCEMKKVNCDGKPHLCLFAVKEIARGEEITYNYGKSSYPWRSKDSYDGSNSYDGSDIHANSTPKKEKFEDSEAASSYEDAGSDDDDDGAPICENESAANSNSQGDVSDNSLEDLDSSQDVIRHDASCSQQEDEAAVSSDESDKDEDYVPRRSLRRPKECSYTSKNYCYACGKGYAKIARHLLTHADEEPEIAELATLPKSSKERRKLLDELRIRGNYKHNQEVFKKNCGKLKMKRRPVTEPAEEISAEIHIYCLFCKCLLRRSDAWRHVARCASKTAENSATDEKTRVLGKIGPTVWKLLLTMQPDETAKAAQSDYLLLQLAASLVHKYGNRYDYIRQRLREMATLLIALHEKSIFSFEEAVKSKNFYKVVEAVKEMAGFDEKMQSYDKPNLALKFGHSLKKIGAIVLAGVDGNERLTKDTKKFMKLCAEEWSELVSKTSVDSSSGQKVNSPSTIPFTQDVQVFHRYLERTAASAIESLEMDGNPQAYSALCRVTLAQASVLNKCAPEVSKMTVETFQERGDTVRVLSKRFIKINVPNETGQNVAVLLTSDLVSAITLLVSKRQACGIHPDNPFLFAKPNSDSTSIFHGGICIGAFSSLCRAGNPEHLRSVHLHKHIARIFQVLNLENDELHHLAKLLGHKIRPDREYYRSPEAAVELAKIAKLILAMEKGSLERFKGNSLEQMEIEDKLEPDVEQGNPGNSDAAVDNEESELLPEQSDAAQPQAVTEKQSRQLDRSAAASSSEDEHVEDSAEATSSDESRFDDEYVPDEELISDDSLTSNSNHMTRRFQKKNSPNPDSSKQQRLVQQPTKASSIKQVEDEANDNPDSFTSDDEPEGPTFTNINYCYVCGKGLTKLSRHLFTHRNEVPEIATVFCLPLHSKERSVMLNELRNRGNFQHNEEVLRTRHGKLKVNRKRPGKRSDLKALAFCLYCKVMRGRKDMWRHVQRCAAKRSSKYRTPAQRKILSLVHAAESTDLKEVSPDVKKFIESLKSDEVTSVILNDPHIQQLAQCIYRTNDGKKKQGTFTNRLRLMGRLLLKLRDKSIDSIEDAVKPQNFSKVVEAAKELVGFNEETKTSAKPSVWLHLGNLLRKIATINYARALKEDADKQKVEEVETFMKLCETEWASVHQSKTANNTPTIPFIHDVQLLFQCLEQTMASGVESLTMYECPQVYHALLRVTVAQVSVSNKNMAEVSKVTLKSFNERDKTEPHEDAAVCQSQLDQILSKRSVKINVRNNKGRKVAVTLTPKLLDALTLLVSKRDTCGVHEKNVFLFAKPTATWMSFYQGHVCFTMFVGRCGAKNKVNLRSVCFRKHVARFFQILSLTNEELEQLAKLLGRDIRTDREYYQTPEAAVDIAKISELLTAMESGSLERFEGKSLEEIEIADELEPDMEQENPEKCDAERDESDVENDNCDAGDDNDESGSSLQLSGISSSKASCSTTKNPSKCSRYFPGRLSGYSVKKCGRGRPRKQERKNAASELKDVSTEKNDWPEETPESYDVNTPEKTLSRSSENATRMSFSDDDEDMNVDFDMDFDSFSTTEKPSNSPSPISDSSPKNWGRGRPRKQEREKNAASELKDVSTERNDWSEETPESCDMNTPEKTLSRSNESATKMSFSDDDEDMNVDFDMDFDSDEDIRNEEYVGDGDSVVVDKTKQDNDSSDAKKTDGSPEYHSSVANLEEAKHVAKDDPRKGAEKNGGSRRSCATLNTEKNKLLAAMAGMKEVKILIPKLDITKLKDPAHISRLSSVSNSVKQPLKDQPVHDAKNQSPTAFTSTNYKTKPSNEKTIQMTCSRCKKSMTKGQTAFQKKGFTDVFCSKNCLFEIFPINKPAAKKCHHCQKTILQPQDLIMAAVDTKGTMKDFCTVTCLSSFKSKPESSQTPPSVCSKCSKSCTITCEVTLYTVVHKFCSGSCFDDFLRDNTDICENCSTTCTKKPLMLKLEEETITICSGSCLDEFIEFKNRPCRCTNCHISNPCSEMVHDKSSENIVELFCTRNCVASYRLAIEYKLHGKEYSAQLNKKKRNIKLFKEKLSTADSTVNRNVASPAAESDTPTIIIADSSVVCCLCGKELPKGQTLYQTKSSPEVYCSASCLSERHPSNKLGTKSCYNCLQVIMRPHNMILAPVDDSGTVRELCSNTCLTSVNSKRNNMSCRMCSRLAFCKVRQSLDGLMLRVCSDACFINYHRVNNFPVFTCDVCSSVFINKPLMLKREDGSKTICSEECLVKVKENIETAQMCPMCQTSHQMSDMVEDRNDEGSLDFFCSNRCMMVHKAQSVTVSERNSPPLEEEDIKEVKPSLPNLGSIKEEPSDEEYKQYFSFSISAEDIKDEPKVAKEDLKIGSVFSFTDQDTSTVPTETKMDLTASCSNCKNSLVDGETVYQRKSHAEIFCSSPCLLNFYQMKQAKNTCHFCLQEITNPRDVLKAPADTEETMKDFCSQACLSSFNYKRITSAKIHIKPVASRSQCSMCSRYCISRHEIIHQDVVHKLCSEPCFLRFCNMNNLSVCVNCGSHCNTPVVLKMKDGRKKLCGAECLAQFRKKTQTQQPCAMCCTARSVTDMVENENSENEVELFCTTSCVMASKIQAVSASGLPLDCDHCGKTTVPACHLAMSDASIRNFCTLTCAMTFKETQNVDSNPTAASDQSQCDLHKPPEKLLCAQCRRILKTTPEVVQKKGKMNFVCSLACSEEFKRVNNIMGKCEYCKNERIIKEVKKVDNKDCYFCSDGCRMLYHHELKEKWGEYCHCCAYCLSISKTVVTAQYKGTEEEFCSEDCSANYNMLFCHVAKCDTCGHQGNLRQSLPILGEVKHFCDLKCLLHFCNKKVQMVNTVSSPSRPAGTVESSPVIANVISLAGALARQHRASASSAKQVSVSDIQTKVVGHASVQTVPKELKNKSTLCTPLVHNKGVSCTTQTVDTEAQTDKCGPTVLPVPVPVFIPVPMNMYSQYTPKPVCLPIPLPVPVFLPVMSNSPEREDGQKDGEVTKEGQRQETHTSKEHKSNCSDDPHADQRGAFKDQEDSFSDTHKETPLHSQVCESSAPQPELQTPAPLPAPAPAPPPAPVPASAPAPAVEMREDPRSSPSSATDPPLLQQTVGKVHNKNKGRKLHQSSKAAKAASRKHRELKSRRGADAWRRWIQWRESQTDPDLVSSPSLTFSKDVHRCSAAELSDGLCCFVTEVKRPDGEPYSPDSLFYLCLGIQQHLLENGHMENIFSDPIFKKFSVRITKILKGFKPSATASGFIYSRVEEEFLWDCKQLGAYSPIILLNTLLFFSCKYFGFTTMKQHRQLSFAHLRCCSKTNQNNTKTSFLRFYPPKSFNEAETDGVPAKRRKRDQSKEGVLEMMENPENPLRCPVRLYEFYLSKCPESVRQRADLFYLHPDHSCVPSSPLWFSSTPLDDSTVEAMLVQILAVREVQRETYMRC
ncbi:uncharacterized protein LOC119016720 isoform X3 [Acanthopagrus latus]|uniref:uncharacterized protein LOC119016720 isoform X3 n=1 Tax=Acanthopagrus latus TaxID=8177 RepID=UPI00187C8736|nr:uncharacterized protein LOC119016720 isoform X3 [Acanthopagrus latus]